MIDYLQTVPAEYYIAAYLLCGFVGGYFAAKASERPAATWLFCTFCGPFIVAAMAILILPFLPFGLLCAMLGIKAPQDVNDRF